MQKDPMFSWRPSMKASRSVGYRLSQNIIESTGESVITITFRPEDVGATAALLQEANDQMAQVGYVHGERPAGTQGGRAYSILCHSFDLDDHSGIVVELTGFVWK
jgi:hypothetical protein